MKESILIKIMRYFFSIRGVLDEHSIREINKVATNAFMYLWIYTGVANGALLMVSDKFLTHSTLIWFLFVNLIVAWGGVSFYVTRKVSKLKLNYHEVSVEEYPKAVHQAIIHGGWFSVIYGIFFYFLTTGIQWSFSLSGILVTLFIVALFWTSDTQREIGHIVKVE